MGLLDKLRNVNNKEVTLNDLKNLNGMKDEIESQLAQQKKQKEKELYRMKCRCGAVLPLQNLKEQKAYCPNNECLSKYHVKLLNPVDTMQKGAFTTKDRYEGNVPEPTYEVHKPEFDPTHIGYAYETDRFNYPASDLTVEQILIRCAKEKNINKNLDLAFDDLKDAVLKLYKLVRGLYKK